MAGQGIKPTKTTPKKMGAPSKFTQQIANELCAYLAMGESLRTACSHENMPAVATVFNWFQAYPNFLEQYTRAKKESADFMAEDILDIADNATNDWMERNDTDNEGYNLNGEHIARSRLRVETRKWLMAKMKPKVYGDKIDLTSDGKALPTPILGFMGDADTKRDVVEAEIVEPSAPNPGVIQSGNIMDDINSD